jgi:ribosome biogenesis GTPase
MSSFEFALPLGWDAGWASAFAPHARAGLIPARVARVDRGQCATLTPSGPVRADVPRGIQVCTGDWAALAELPPGPVVAAVLPRRSALTRAAVSGRSEGQTLAANIDVVGVVVSCAAEPDLGRIERLLALAWESGARPVVALTKADACPDGPHLQADVASAAVAAETVLTSAVTGQGLDELAACLTGSVVLIGQSGAGKSTLAAALTGVDLAVDAVRDRDSKGRHTTTWRELLPLLSGAGVLIDTPGLRGVGLRNAEEGLQLAFVDIEDLAEQCRFDDCGHDTEPGCAVKAAIDAGTLPERRLASYRKLRRENAWAASRTDARLRAEQRAKYRVQAKALRQSYSRPGRPSHPRHGG